MTKIVVKNNLLKYLRSRNISIRQLSEITGITSTGLYKRGNPTLKTIAAILVALNCNFEDIFEIVEQ